MVEIEFYDGDRVIKGFLLGKYQRPHDGVYAYEKKVLWKTRTIYAHRKLNTPLYVIFIPWRHQLKELREVDEKDIVNSQSLNEDDAWIKKDKFISEIQDDFGYSPSFEVKDFIGYKFMYDNNSFIAKLCLHEFTDCLTILYKNMPEVLDADLGNKEDWC